MRMAKKLIDKSIPRFLLVGVGNTLLSMALMFLLEGLGYWPSTAIAYVAGAVMSFFLNRHFTFRSQETLGRSAIKFAVNVAVCYVLSFSMSKWLVPTFIHVCLPQFEGNAWVLRIALLVAQGI